MLLPVLDQLVDQLVAAAAGTSIRTNEYALRWLQDIDRVFAGTTLGAFPRGMSCSPLTWKYLDMTIPMTPMTLAGGFVGISQDPETCAVRPAIGWAVREAAR